MSEGPDFAFAFPVLPSTDLVETRAFYADILGFDKISDDPDYLIVRREQIELHFWLTDNAELPKVSSCYIRGGQIRDLYAEYRARSVPGLSEFKIQPWNMAEFHLLDPQGNLLRFGCIPDE